MPTQSKWQSLPTEAINPVSLAVDKAPVSDIIDMVVNEDRKVIAAVQKEKERIAHGIEIITQSLRKGGRIIFVLLEIVRRGKRIAPQKEALVHLVGFALIITFAVVVTYFDVLRVLRGESLFR